LGKPSQEAKKVAGGQYRAMEVVGRLVQRREVAGGLVPRTRSRRKVSTAQMESREGQYRAKEVAGGQYRVMEVTGRLVPHTRSRRKVTTAQTKSRGVITAHWRSLIKSGSVVATLWIPDIACLALRGSCDASGGRGYGLSLVTCPRSTRSMLPPHPPSMRPTRCSCVPPHPPSLYSQARCARVPLVCLRHST